MKYVPYDKWPLWIRERIGDGRNLELKERQGRFYLYKRTDVWDKELRRPRKTVKYVGTLREKRSRIREHGNVALVMHLMNEHGIIDSVKKTFPGHWEDLLVFSLNRLICPSPLKRMGSWADKTTLPGMTGAGVPSGKRLSAMLSFVGTSTRAQADFMRSLMKNGELLLYDGSVIHSDSEYNKLLEVGYNKDKLFVPKANVTLLFSRERNVPVHFRVFFGSVNEIRTVEAIMNEIGGREMTFIADKGFHSKDIHAMLDEAGAGFVMPIPRSDKRIDYASGLGSVFRYNKRIIKGGRVKTGVYWLYMYEDQLLKYTETTQYHGMRIDEKGTGGRRRNAYREEWAGRIALLSNRKLGTEEAYLLWKTRDRIEKAFGIMQRYLEVDHPYVSGEDAFRGYMFSSFISLIGYYLILNLLQKHGVNGKVSVSDLLFELSKIMVEECGYASLVEVPAKVEKLAKSIDAWDILTKNRES